MRRLGAGLLLTIAIAGCFGPRADPSTFFQLSPVPPPAAQSPLSASIGLGPVTVPAYLDRLQLVTRLSDNQLEVNETERWAEPLAEGVARTLEENLSALLPGSTYVRFPWYAAAAPEYAVQLDLRRFEGDGVGLAVLEGTWSLSRGGEPIGGRTLRLEETGAGPTRADQVAVLSRLLSSLCSEIAVAVRGSAGR
jgi:uncharacterized lipoprotein YmbA